MWGAGNSIFIEELNRDFLAFGIEPSPEALHLTARCQRQKNMVGGLILSLPVHDEIADVVIALDVLEHIPDDVRALTELLRITQIGGVVIVTVPACSWAMSDWDAVLGHYRRYDLTDIKRLLRDQRVEVLKCRYMNIVLCWPIILYRLARKNLFKNLQTRRLEDFMPPP